MAQNFEDVPDLQIEFYDDFLRHDLEAAGFKVPSGPEAEDTSSETEAKKQKEEEYDEDRRLRELYRQNDESSGDF